MGARTVLAPQTWAGIATSGTYRRYVDGIELPSYVSITNSLIIAYGIIVAVHVGSTGTLRLRMFGPLVVFLLSNMLVTTRASLVMLLTMMVFAGIYAERLGSPSQRFRPMFSRMNLKAFLAVVALLKGVLFYFQVLRFGDAGSRSLGDTWDRLRRWPFGSMSAFSAWFDGNVPAEPPRVPGSYTLMGVFDNLDIEARVVGGYTYYAPLARGESGNVYTAFHGFVHDFGWLGAILVSGIVGLVGGAATAGRVFRPGTSAALYTGVASFLAFSWVVSLFA